MNLSDLRDLGPTMRADQVAALWGCSAWSVYAMRKAGTLPVEPLSLGRNLVWPTVQVLSSIGIDAVTLFSSTPTLDTDTPVTLVVESSEVPVRAIVPRDPS